MYRKTPVPQFLFKSTFFYRTPLVAGPTGRTVPQFFLKMHVMEIEWKFENKSRLSMTAPCSGFIYLNKMALQRDLTFPTNAPNKNILKLMFFFHTDVITPVNHWINSRICNFLNQKWTRLLLTRGCGLFKLYFACFIYFAFVVVLFLENISSICGTWVWKSYSRQFVFCG